METSNKHYLLLYKQLCVADSIFYKADTFISQKQKEYTDAVPTERNNSLTLGKEEAKKTCLELGFKAGTTKYLNCVLELLWD